MTSFLTGAFGDYLGDAVAAAVGLEHTDAEFSKRAEAAFKHADADGSGALDFGETYAACRAVPGLKHLSEARAREIFRRFDEDDSGSLDVEEFKKLAALLRSAHALDQMPGVIYCGGRLMNPSMNQAVAEAARLKELYSKPYQPRSVLAKAIAKPTVRRRVVYGGVDLDNLEALTDDEETNSISHRSKSDAKSDAKKRRRRRTSREFRVPKPWSIGALETVYVSLLLLRLLCAVLGTGYIHPDEYHQTVEIGARDVLSVASSPRAWEFDSASPTRSVAGHVLAAGASFRVWRFLARFDRNAISVAKAMLAGAAGGCEKAALARGVAAGLRTLESRLFRETPASFDGFERVSSGDDKSFERAFVDDDAFVAVYVSPLVIFLAPRVFAFCASLLVDLAAARAARAAYWAQAPKSASLSRRKPSRRGDAGKSFSGAAKAGLHARLFVASAWPAVTLLVRPLTNAAECVLVSVLLCLVCAPNAFEDDDDDGVFADAPGKLDAEKTKEAAFLARRRRARDLTRAAFKMGAVTALGTWTRFTFPLFAAPLGALLVVRAARAEKTRGALVAATMGAAGFVVVALVLVVVDTNYFKGREVTKEVFFGTPSLVSDNLDLKTAIVTFVGLLSDHANDALAFAKAWFRDPRLPPSDAFSVAWRETSKFVAATRFTAARFVERCLDAPWVVTPYNAFKYNVTYVNLATHGIHPRLTHLLVNFPMLFGALAFTAYRAAFGLLAGAARKKKKTVVHEASKTVSSANATRAALLFTLIVPLFCLSLAPHQEPRFLLPLLPAAAAAAAADGAAARFAASPATLVAWSATNFLAAGFFGFAHQGGVVPAVAQMSTILAEDDKTSEHALVYFWRTYTPPESLLAFPAEPRARVEKVDALSKTNGSPNDALSSLSSHKSVPPISPSHVVDLQGASMDSVLAAFASNEDWSHFYVVAPATAAAELRKRLKETAPGTVVSETWRRPLHFSSEELVGYRDAFARGGLRELWDAMSLGVYAVER